MAYASQYLGRRPACDCVGWTLVRCIGTQADRAAIRRPGLAAPKALVWIEPPPWDARLHPVTGRRLSRRWAVDVVRGQGDGADVPLARLFERSGVFSDVLEWAGHNPPAEPDDGD